MNNSTKSIRVKSISKKLTRSKPNLNFQKILQKHIFSVAKIFQVSVLEIAQNPKIWLAKPEFKKTLKLLERGFPVDYLIGEVQIGDLFLKLNKNTLIPRSETEFWLPIWTKEIIDKLKKLDSQNQKNWSELGTKNKSKPKSRTKSNLKYKPKKIKVAIVDVGTGSGLIILHLQKALSQCHFVSLDLELVAVDIDRSALKIAKENHLKNLLSNSLLSNIQPAENGPELSQNSNKSIPNKINFYVSDNLKNLSLVKKINQAQYVFLVSNPPYLPVSDIQFADKNKVSWEPRQALYSGNDGLDTFRDLLSDIKKIGIWPKVLSLVVELDPRNVEKAKEITIQEIANSGGFCNIDRPLLMDKKSFQVSIKNDNQNQKRLVWVVANLDNLG